MIFYNQVVLFEGKGAYASLKQSWEITNGYFANIFFIFIAIITPILLVVGLEPTFPNSSITIIFMALINTFFLLWMNSALTITYLQLVSDNLSKDFTKN